MGKGCPKLRQLCSEQALIASLHEHLWRLIKETSHIDSRQTVAKRLRSELKQLKKEMRKN